VTQGGVAPTTGCDASHVGIQRSVLDTAYYYYFYVNTRVGRETSSLL
jgi:hypothetical protein